MISIDNDRCKACGGCVTVCPENALCLKKFLTVNDDCIDCQICEKFCPVGALS